MMTPDAAFGLASGFMCFFACVAAFAHAGILMPDRPNYPDAPRRLVEPLLVWGGVLGYRGAELVSSSLSNDPGKISLGVFMVSCMVAVIHTMLLEDTARKWLPARVHARIRHLLNIATCGHGRAIRKARRSANAASTASESESPHVVGLALVELSRQGMTVVAPMEGPDALLEEPLMPKRKAR